MKNGVQPGERVGPYVVDSALGRGGMGVVWRARHSVTGVRVALKTIALARESQVVAIRREVRALRRIEHPGIVRIVDDGVDGGRPWYAMDLLELPTLADRRDQHFGALSAGALSDDAVVLEADCVGPAVGLSGAKLLELLGVVRSLCAPLGHLHASGMVHRDLKPANILVRPDNSAVLLDFGLISTFGSQGRDFLDALGDVRGTPAFMAPEQFRGEHVDARADLYSLGCILYQLVTGRPPFIGSSVAELARGHEELVPTRPGLFGPGVDPALEALILRLLSKDRRHRLGHADDVAAALAALGAGGPNLGPAGPRSYLYRAPLVERDEPLQRLCELSRRASTEEHGGLVILTGESGSGKTALASALAGKASTLGLKVATAECPAPVDAAHPEPVPFVAFRAVLDLAALHVVTNRSAPPALLTHLKTLVPVDPTLESLPGVAGLPAPPDLPPEEQASALVDAVVGLIFELADHLGVLLVIDDVQWADPLSFVALERLVRGGTAEGPGIAVRPLAIIVTVRRGEEPRALTPLMHFTGVETIALGRLARAGVGVMAAEMLALPSAPEALVDLLYRYSEGNPFFAAAYLRSAVSEGYIERRGGTWQATASDFARIPLPASLQELLDRRLRVPGADEVLAAAAVLGGHFDEAAIQAVAGLPANVVDDLVTDCLARDILQPDADGKLAFSHSKLREATYARIAAPQRAALHARAGTRLFASPDDATSLAAAEHFRLAGESAQLFEALLRAGGYAVRTAAFGTALELLREAEPLAAVGEHSDTELATFHRLLGEASLATSDDAGGRHHLGEALRLLGEPVPDRGGALVLGLLGAALGQLKRRLFPRRPALTAPDDPRIHALAQLQVAERSGGDVGRILYTTVRSLNLAEDLNAPSVMASGFALAQAIAGAIPWPAAAARYRVLAHEALARAEHDPVTEAWVRQMDAVSDLGAGRLSASLESATAALEIARRLRLSQRQQESLVVHAYASLLMGRLPQALEDYTSLGSAALGASPRNARWGLAGQCLIAVRQGRDAREPLDALHALASLAAEPLDVLAGRAAAALVAARDRHSSAAGHAETAAETLLGLPASLLEAAFPATLLAEALWLVHGADPAMPGPRTLLSRVAKRVGAMARAQPFLGAEAALYEGASRRAHGKDPTKAYAEAERIATKLEMPITAWRARRAADAVARRPARSEDTRFADENGLWEAPWLNP